MKTALLFDLDGTLILSDELHARVFVDLLAPFGITIDDDFFRERLHGRLNEDIFTDLCPGEDPHALGDAKEAEFRRLLGSSFPQVPGTEALLDLADRMGWAKGVVTNAPKENAEASLGALGIRDRFDVVVLAEECVRAKPDPEPYLQALRLLGADAQASLAFEDSASGLRAAVAAGIPTVGLRSLLDDAGLRALGACLSVETFDDPALAALLGELAGTE